ncbi:efflux RND transporter periplasmic adaptor subunit [Archangium violaceum]|uniref:efflux RND transporter periplasmic adaptor subunit n=1 Tax=Archangium violaceum TaxID=83451 RepID=UPI0036D9FD6C
MRTSLVGACLLGVLSACKPGPEQPGPAPRPQVKVAPAARGPVELEVLVRGVFAPLPGKDVKLAALVAGRVSRVLVVEGDPIRAGQVLAELEAGPSLDELRQAEAGVGESEVALEAARARRLRTEELVRHGVAAQQDAEQDRSAEAAARASLERARATQETARRKVALGELRAPFDGVVLQVLVRQGEAVDGTGQPILEVAAADPVELRGTLNPEESARMTVGARAQVRSLPGGTSLAPGEVVAVAPAADPQSGNVGVRVRLPNPSGHFKLGAPGEAAITVGRESSAVTIPTQALLPGGEDGGARVATLDAGRVHLVEVQVRAEQGARAILEGGLDGGESVIVEGGYSLPEGTEVEQVR